MSNEETIERVRQRARKNFSLGYNCSECVFEALLGELELDLPPEAIRLATGFGGGVGLYGGTCGAIAGAVLAVGAVHGRRNLPEGEGLEVAQKSKQQFYGRPGIYRIFNQIPNEIAAKYGSTVCGELTRKWQSQWLCREHALSCRELITDAAGVAARLALAERDVEANRPFGANVEGIKEQ
ncbi:MAG: C-GCAxxG-C-C family protein [Dehalococcoidia bacterium]|nr:C-GCAxxG-C-C family protein [Dehalococcoidia bacterium]